MSPSLTTLPPPSTPWSQLSSIVESQKKRLIEPTYSPFGINPTEYDFYVNFIEQALYNVLPEKFLKAFFISESIESRQTAIQELFAELPLLLWNAPEFAPSTLSFTLLCHSEYTGGVGRYLCDVLSRWLVPGKFLNISSVRSLNFRLLSAPHKQLYFNQILLDAEEESDLAIIHNNWSQLHREIRLSILSVRHARHITSVHQLSSEQKKAMIEENLASAADFSSQELNDNIFNYMHSFLMQLSAEDKVKQIKEQLSPSQGQRQRAFQRDIFDEIKHCLLLFGNSFTAVRNVRHVSRLISFFYLFRKSLKRLLLAAPEARHLNLKIFKTQLNGVLDTGEGKYVVGIVGAMNILRENELFEARHIIETVSHSIPNICYSPNSIILDRRSHDPVRLFYLEIEKSNGSKFTNQEIQELKKELPRQLKESVENIFNPVLIPRNEEEIIRNTLLLSQQLKLTYDLPQVILSFAGQTENELLFTVILLRVFLANKKTVKEIFKGLASDFQLKEIEVKNAGLLRKKHPKEANIIKMALLKKKYLRKDFTIDLFKARQDLSAELDRLFGGIRDFNGGILSKQQEVFQELREMIADKNANENFLLENFFYSLSPPLRQTSIPAASLKRLFLLMQEALEVDYKKESFLLNPLFEEEQLLLLAATEQSCLKEALFSLIKTLEIPASELSYTYVNAYGIHCMGYIYQNRDPEIRKLFYSTLLNYMQEWKLRMKK